MFSSLLVKEKSKKETHSKEHTINSSSANRTRNSDILEEIEEKEDDRPNVVVRFFRSIANFFRGLFSGKSNTKMTDGRNAEDLVKETKVDTAVIDSVAGMNIDSAISPEDFEMIETASEEADKVIYESNMESERINYDTQLEFESNNIDANAVILANGHEDVQKNEETQEIENKIENIENATEILEEQIESAEMHEDEKDTLENGFDLKKGIFHIYSNKIFFDRDNEGVFHTKGDLNAEICINNEVFASGGIENAKISNDEIFLDSIELGFNNIESFIPEFSMSGNASINGLVVHRDDFFVNSAEFNLSAITYGGRKIAEAVSLNVSDTAGKEQELSVKIDTAENPLEIGEFSTSLENTALYLHIAKGSAKPGLSSEKLSVKYGGFTFESGIPKWYFGDPLVLTDFKIENEGMKGAFSRLFGIESFSISGSSAAVDRSGIAVEDLEASVGGNLTLFGGINLNNFLLEISGKSFSDLNNIKITSDLSIEAGVIKELTGNLDVSYNGSDSSLSGSANIAGIEMGNVAGLEFKEPAGKIDLEKKSAEVSVKEISGRMVKASDISFEIGKDDLRNGNGTIQIMYLGKEPIATASVKDLNVDTNGLSFQEISVAADKTILEKISNNNFDIAGARGIISSKNGKFDAKFAAEASLDYKKGFFGASAKSINVNINYNSEDGADSNFKFEVSGKINAGVYIGEQSLAEVEISDIGFDNKTLTIANAAMKLNTSAFLSDLDMEGGIEASNITVGKDKFEVSSLNLVWSDIKYRDNILASSGSWAISSFEPESEWEISITPVENNPLRIGNFSTSMESAVFYIAPNAENNIFGLESKNFIVSYKSFVLAADIPKFYLGDPITLENASLKNDDIKSSISKYIEVNSFEFGADKVVLNKDSVTAENFSGKISANANLFDVFQVEDINVEINAKSFDKIDSFSISAMLLYSSDAVKDFNGEFGLKYEGENETYTPSAKLSAQIDGYGVFSVEELNAKADFEQKRVSAEIKKAALKNDILKFSDIALEIDKEGLKNGKAAMSVAIAQKELFSGSAEGISITSSGFSLDQAGVQIAGFTLLDKFNVSSAAVDIKLADKTVSLGISAKAEIKSGNGILRLNASDLDAKLNYDGKENNGGFGEFSGSLSGNADIGVYLGDNKAAGVSVNDFKATGESFSVGNIDMAVNTSALSGGLISIEGNVTAKNAEIKNGVFDSEEIAFVLGPVKYRDNVLTPKLSASFTNSDTQEVKVSIDTEDSPISIENFRTELTGTSVYLNLQKDKLSFGIESEKFLASYKSFEAEGKIDKSYLDGDITIPYLSAKNTALSEKVVSMFGIKSFEFDVTDVVIGKDDLLFKKAEMSIGTDSTMLYNKLTVQNLKFSLEGEGIKKIKKLSASAKLSYKGDIVTELGGNIDAEINEGGNSFLNASELTLAIAKLGSGSFKELIIDENNLLIKNAVFTHRQADGAVSDGQDLADKLLNSVPEFSVAAEEIGYKDGKFIVPSMDKLEILSLKKEISLFDDAVKGFLSYEKGDIEAELAAVYKLPKSRNGNCSEKIDESKIKRLVDLNFGFPIIPPFITANITGSVFAGFDAGAAINFSKKKGDNSSLYKIGTKMNLTADAGVGVGVGIRASVGVASAGVSLMGNGVVSAEGNLEGILGIAYDHAADTIKNALSLDRDNTSLSFDVSGNLRFEVAVSADAGIPAIFVLSEKKVRHSWTLFTYEFGSVNLSGRIAADPQTKEFFFDGDGKINLNAPGKFDTEASEKLLKTLDGDYKNLEETMKELDTAFDEAFSQNKEILGAEEIFGSIRAEKLFGLQEKLRAVIKTGTEKMEKSYEEILKIKKFLDESRYTVIKTKQSKDYLDTITSQSAEILDIIGKDGGEDISGDYVKVMGKLRAILNDDKTLDTLANKDPVAIINTFKAYKFSSSDAWSKTLLDAEGKFKEHYTFIKGEGKSIHDFARERSMAMYENNEAVNKYLDVAPSAESTKKLKKEHQEKITQNQDSDLSREIKDLKKLSDSEYKKLEKAQGNYKNNVVEIGRKSELIAQLQKDVDAESEKAQKDKKSKQLDKLKKSLEKEIEKRNKLGNEVRVLSEKHFVIQKQIEEKTSGLDGQFASRQENLEKLDEFIEERGSLKAIETSEDEFKKRRNFVITMIHQIIDSYDHDIKKGHKVFKKAGSEMVMNDDAKKRSQERAEMIKNKKLADETLESDLSIPESRLSLLRDYEKMSKCYVDYNTRAESFYTFTKNAMDKMEIIIQDNYSGILNQSDIVEKSNNIKSILENIDPANVDKSVNSKLVSDEGRKEIVAFNQEILKAQAGA